MPATEGDAAKHFYARHLGGAAEAGFDFLKIDDQATNIRLYRGTEDPVRANRVCQEAKEDLVKERFAGLMNCMAHNTLCLFNARHSASTRCSTDYRAGNAIKGRSHLFQALHNLLWMGQTVWGDHEQRRRPKA